LLIPCYQFEIQFLIFVIRRSTAAFIAGPEKQTPFEMAPNSVAALRASQDTTLFGSGLSSNS
jgi:hypothetical protein